MQVMVPIRRRMCGVCSTRSRIADDGDKCAKEIGTTMETVVVWVLACVLYWWGLL